MTTRLKLICIFAVGLVLCGIENLAQLIADWADRNCTALIERGEKIKAGK